jgi:methylmalonyl-CoA/ethylmalonyl-CoA epimerase
MEQSALRLHHFGLACRDLDAEEALLSSLGYTRETDDFSDPTLGVRGRFLVGHGVRFELLVELEASGVLAPWLRTGTTIYHQAFLTPMIDDTIRHLTATLRAKLVRPPTPAVAFDGRPVAFLVLPSMELIEIIESPPGAFVADEGASADR